MERSTEPATEVKIRVRIDLARARIDGRAHKTNDRIPLSGVQMQLRTGRFDAPHEKDRRGLGGA